MKMKEKVSQYSQGVSQSHTTDGPTHGIARKRHRTLQLHDTKHSKTCLKQPLKIDKSKILMTNGSLMEVKCIAECSAWIILQYFWSALSDN